MVIRHKLKHGFYFRYFGENYNVKKPGLFFLNHFWKAGEKIPLRDKEIIELRDWLSRYINERILKTVPASIPEMRSSARAIEKGLKKLEAEV